MKILVEFNEEASVSWQNVNYQYIDMRDSYQQVSETKHADRDTFYRGIQRTDRELHHIHQNLSISTAELTNYSSVKVGSQDMLN